MRPRGNTLLEDLALSAIFVVGCCACWALWEWLCGRWREKPQPPDNSKKAPLPAIPLDKPSGRE